MRTGFGLTMAAIAVAIAWPALAAGEEPVVPPGNSAVNQYTETYPTAGGDKDFDEGGKSSPGKTLGAGNARRLEQTGPDGRAAAEVASETAPVVGAEGSTPPVEESPTAGGGGGGSSGDGDDRVAQAARGQNEGAGEPAGGQAPDVEGSSGFDQALAQATGVEDSGEMGLWLPLLLLATAIGSLAYLLHRRRAES